MLFTLLRVFGMNYLRSPLLQAFNRALSEGLLERANAGRGLGEGGQRVCGNGRHLKQSIKKIRN